MNVNVVLGAISNKELQAYNRHFSKRRKLATWQLVDCYRHLNYNYQGKKTDFLRGFADIIYFYTEHKIFYILPGKA